MLRAFQQGSTPLQRERVFVCFSEHKSVSAFTFLSFPPQLFDFSFPPSVAVSNKRGCFGLGAMLNASLK